MLYLLQGSNSAGGAADGAWGNRPERLLSAALLRLDLNKLPANLPLDAFTSQDQNVINNADISTAATDLPGLGGFDDPLDIIEDVRNGNLYVSDFGNQTIILLVPN